jgi:hypothetical protein
MRLAVVRERRVATHEAGHCVAALAYSIPVISVTIADGTPHLHRARYRAPHDLGLETVVTMCLAGPCAEELFCGAITDGGDLADYEIAREYLSRSIANQLQAAAALVRYRVAAERLVRSTWAQHRIRSLADQLLRCGVLSGEEIQGI